MLMHTMLQPILGASRKSIIKLISFIYYNRYMREYAILVKSYCSFISIDDKHKIKIGEPSCPVASAERGRRVIVRSDEVFAVSDHDFTKFGLIPSVVFLIDIPDEISESWYHGECNIELLL